MKRTALDDRQIRWRTRSRAPIPGGTAYDGTGGLLAIVSREDGRWHVSVSHPKRYPTWDEMASARERFTPDEVTMAMLLPPRGEYVNLHSTCLHLWELVPPEAGGPRG